MGSRICLYNQSYADRETRGVCGGWWEERRVCWVPRAHFVPSRELSHLVTLSQRYVSRISGLQQLDVED